MPLVKRKSIVIVIFTILLLAFFIGYQDVVATKISDTGLDTTAGTAFGQIPFHKTEPAKIIGQVIGAMLAFVGVLFLVLMIYGGFMWMTARGNDQQITQAKGIITGAIVGLIIIFAAYAITALIGNVLLGGGDG